jgi:hypothetical protein
MTEYQFKGLIGLAEGLFFAREAQDWELVDAVRADLERMLMSETISIIALEAETKSYLELH